MQHERSLRFRLGIARPDEWWRCWCGRMIQQALVAVAWLLVGLPVVGRWAVRDRSSRVAGSWA